MKQNKQPTNVSGRRFRKTNVGQSRNEWKSLRKRYIGEWKREDKGKVCETDFIK